MKKTFTVNLNSVVFNIDDDAYEVLKKYLADVAAHFSSEEEKEDIMADIEARIAELFSEKITQNKNVITVEDVREVIGIMGTPSQFSDEEETSAENASKSEKKKRVRRFYRDPENAILGGVAGGLSAYIGLDVTIIRIILILLVFIGFGLLIPVYLVVWIITPEAITPSQRLEMQGEDITIDNIKSEFDNARTYVQSENFKNSARTVGQRLGQIFKWIVKIVLGFVGAILSFVGIILLIVLIPMLILALCTPFAFFDMMQDFIPGITVLQPENPIMLLISLILLVGCPIFLVIYWIIRLATGRKTQSRTTFWVTLVLWLTGIFMFISVGTKTAIQYKNDNQEWVINHHTGSMVKENRGIPSYSAVCVKGNFKIVIEDHFSENILLKGDSEFLPYVQTEVRDSTLFIYANGIDLEAPVRIELGVDKLTELNVEGATFVKTKGALAVENLSCAMQGVAKADINILAGNTLDFVLEGVSDLKVQGMCENVYFKASGVSRIRAGELKASNTNIKVEGFSSADVYASERFDGTANGFARIDCTGNPIIQTKVTEAFTRIDIR